MSPLKERPILFSRPMVKALWNRKRQTRRVVKIDREIASVGSTDQWAQLLASNDCFGRTITDAQIAQKAEQLRGRLHPLVLADGTMVAMMCPYGSPGDRLWVRESFRLCAEADAIPPRATNAAYRVWYEADTPHQPGFGRLRSGMFMPRWASRITLEITSVRVEQLQDICRTDAIAEGLDHVSDGGSPWGVIGIAPSWSGDPRKSYRALWESINGPGSWDANPWVWVIEFALVAPVSVPSVR